MIWLYIVIGIIAFAFLCFLAVTLVCYIKPFFQRHHKKEDHYRLPEGKHFERNQDKMFALIAEMEAVPYERVFTTSFDGLRLSARYYHVADGAPLQIQVPGYRGTSVRDFCGGNKLARKLGFNTLLLDLRAHGQSQGHTITFGIRERQDVVSWVNYALQRFGAETKIWLVGVSMGGATVLMASELELPKNVMGIIADCPFATPEAIIADSCQKMGLNPKVMMPFIKLSAKMWGHFRLDEATALDAVKHSKLPILLIHGEDDEIVPCEMSKKIYENCACYAELHTFPKAGHGLSYMQDNARYEAAICEFISKTDSGSEL